MAASDPLPPNTSADLADFARSAKAAARSVSLYPSTHPAIQGALRRVVSAAQRLASAGDVTLTVEPDAITIDGRGAARPDPSIAELAILLHHRLVGTLRFEREATPDAWLALLLLLSKSPEDLYAGGGLARAWAATGHGHFEIREIDYSEVLRERAGTGSAAWDRIVAFCLAGDSGSIDDSALAAALELVGDSAQLTALLERLDSAATGAPVGARAAALLKLLRTLLDVVERHRPEDAETMLRTAASAAGRLTPDMLLGLIEEAKQTEADGKLVDGVIGRMEDETVSTFVAGSVIAERGATQRLAQAFQALVREPDRKERLLDDAKEQVAASELGQDAGFEELWKNTAGMLKSYSDENYVSADYGRELSGARAQALEIERVSDDPPDRVQAWLATVSDDAIGAMDLALILDLLRLEDDPEKWSDIATIAVREIERRTVLGNAAVTEPLVAALVKERQGEGRAGLRTAATAALDALAAGALVRHMVLQLRKIDDREVEPLNRIAHAIGPALVRPFAEALAAEQNARTIRRLRELLLGFGAAGRQSVEQLKNSSNPAVRRTAIDLLRVFGGREALPELASMLDDADPQVQRESIRAIVQIGTKEAHAILERNLARAGSARDAILQHLLSTRDDKVIPLLCYVLNHTAARGKLVQVHVEVIDALGSLSATPESTRTLRDVLFRGSWWAPMRTATLRQSAAAALRRIGSPETLAVLEEAVTRGSRSVRNAARAHADAALRRERARS